VVYVGLKIKTGMEVKELIETIAKALVDNPDRIQVRAIEVERFTEIELRVHPSDLGKVIGCQGRLVNSIRIILAAAGIPPVLAKSSYVVLHARQNQKTNLRGIFTRKPQGVRHTQLPALT
jgi:uncharacterized protein